MKGRTTLPSIRRLSLGGLLVPFGPAGEDGISILFIPRV